MITRSRAKKGMEGKGKGKAKGKAKEAKEGKAKKVINSSLHFSLNFQCICLIHLLFLQFL